jgi:hypothetical protein
MVLQVALKPSVRVGNAEQDWPAARHCASRPKIN